MTDIMGASRHHAVATGRFDAAAALAEGRSVFDCGLREDGTRRIELQRLDDPDDGEPVFADDEQAWRHVVRRAFEGSALHLVALETIDAHERKLIAYRLGRQLPLLQREHEDGREARK